MEDHRKKIERLNLVLQTMRDVSGLIIKEKNRERLLRAYAVPSFNTGDTITHGPFCLMNREMRA